MSCEDFERVVVDLARDQIMSATLRERALGHASECERCVKRFDDERSLTKALRQLAVASIAEPSSVVEAKLLMEFRDAQKRRSLPPRWTPSIPQVVYAAAAIVLVMTVIGGIYLRKRPAPLTASQQVPNVKPTKPAATESPVIAMGTEQVGKPNPVPGGPVKSSLLAPRTTTAVNSRTAVHASRSVPDGRPRSAAANDLIAANTEREIATGFIPIAYGQPPTVQDGGQLVRIELPRSAMARFGLPVNMERYDERVKADLWLSPDGFARAIRFVQ